MYYTTNHDQMSHNGYWLGVRLDERMKWIKKLRYDITDLWYADESIFIYHFKRTARTVFPKIGNEMDFSCGFVFDK